MSRIAFLALAALLLTACGIENGEEGARPSPTTPAPTRPALATCAQTQSGYSVAYPRDWFTNPGEVVPSCTYFDPRPVNVREGTEPDVAIVFSRESVRYEIATDPDSFGSERSRDTATVDGRRAVAVVHETGERGLLPAGTLVYVWVVDLEPGVLIASTHDAPDRDLDRYMTVLDLMMEHLDLTEPRGGEDEEPEGDTSVVARYGGGALPFTVVGEHLGDQLCLFVRSGQAVGERRCWSDEAPDRGLTARSLPAPGGRAIVGGLAARFVPRVLVGLEDQSTLGFRPSRVAGTDVRAWAVPVGPDRVSHTIGYTEDRRMAVVLDARGEPASVLSDVDTRREATAPSEEFALLTGVETGLHAGYDRVAFQFREGVPGFRASYRQRPIREDVSGREVEIDGDAVIVVEMERASGRERTGEGRPTYTGPERVQGAGTFAIREVVRTGDFEGIMTWAIGVRGRLPFRVQTFGNVLVVDVRHPPA